jgi:hypothetical protein
MELISTYIGLLSQAGGLAFGRTALVMVLWTNHVKSISYFLSPRCRYNHGVGQLGGGRRGKMLVADVHPSAKFPPSKAQTAPRSLNPTPSRSTSPRAAPPLDSCWVPRPLSARPSASGFLSPMGRSRSWDSADFAPAWVTCRLMRTSRKRTWRSWRGH